MHYPPCAQKCKYLVAGWLGNAGPSCPACHCRRHDGNAQVMRPMALCGGRTARLDECSEDPASTMA